MYKKNPVSTHKSHKLSFSDYLSVYVHYISSMIHSFVF